MARTSGPTVRLLKQEIKKHNKKHCVKLTGTKAQLKSRMESHNISMPTRDDRAVRRTAQTKTLKSSRDARRRARKDKVAKKKLAGVVPKGYPAPTSFM